MVTRDRNPGRLHSHSTAILLKIEGAFQNGETMIENQSTNLGSSSDL